MILSIHSPKYGVHKVLIDDKDWPRIKNYKWCVEYRYGRLKSIITTVRKNGERKNVRLHKLLTNYSYCDHINGNVLDNRKKNLRRVSHSENMQNRKTGVNNKCGYKGVYPVLYRDKNTIKYKAQIGFRKKQIHIGTYNTAAQAALAYNKAAKQLHGEFAKLNAV